MIAGTTWALFGLSIYLRYEQARESDVLESATVHISIRSIESFNDVIAESMVLRVHGSVDMM